MPKETDDDVTKVAELEGQVTEMEAQIGDLTKQLEAVTKSDDSAAKVAELVGQLNEVTKALEKATTDIEAANTAKAEAEAVAKTAEAVAKLSPDQRSIYDELAKADKKKASDFLDMKEEEKEGEVKKRASNDESVVIEGETIRKSVVGDAVFATMKKQADRIAKNEKDLEIEKKARETAELSKRAEAEFSHVPGTVEERAGMLGAIEKMEEPVKKAFMAVFTQSEKLAKAGFERIGGGHDDPKNEDIAKVRRDFDSKVDEIAKSEKVSRTQALSKARKKYPDLFKQYQGEEAKAN